MSEELTPIGECPFPHEWTDDEWQRLMEEMDPTEDVSVAMRKVHAWRQAAL